MATQASPSLARAKFRHLRTGCFSGAVALIFSVVFFVSHLPHAHAATVTWDNSAGTGVWSTATNWDTNLVPVSGDTVIINNGNTV